MINSLQLFYAVALKMQPAINGHVQKYISRKQHRRLQMRFTLWSVLKEDQ